MGDVAESAGLPATADFMLAVIETEELADQGMQLFKQIKSRYGDKNTFNKFKLEVRKGNQRWMDTDNSEYGFKSDYHGNTMPKTVEQTQGPMIKQAESTRREKMAQIAKSDIQF
ncbi:replication and recombination DNA helicase [Klebsiella phage CPRSA]|nr:replication and recombination DNA helicase [Klebsiella phage CPRSA]